MKYYIVYAFAIAILLTAVVLLILVSDKAEGIIVRLLDRIGEKKRRAEK